MSCFGIVSEQLKESKRFKWEITPFSSFPVETDCRSPSFTFANKILCFELFLPHHIYDDISVYLIGDYFPLTSMNYSLNFQKSDGTFISWYECYQFNRKTISKDVLLEERALLLPNDTLTIICDIEFIEIEKQTVTPAAEANSSREELVVKTSGPMKLTEAELLSKNFKELLISKDYCDVVLLVQGKEFEAHKCILIARSSVFAPMFRHDTAEKQTGKVIIDDCDPDCFQEFLEYLYCGRLDNISSKKALHLYRTSDKYDVHGLKEFCTKYLMQNLTVKNVCDVAVFADEYDEMSLLSSVQKFFNDNLQEIFFSTEWENLFKKNFRLANNLLKEMSKVKK